MHNLSGWTDLKGEWQHAFSFTIMVGHYAVPGRSPAIMNNLSSPFITYFRVLPQ